jgi:DNA-binding transcriptional ArsR family regulator
MRPFLKVMIFSGLFGNETAAKVLLYLQELESSYPRAIAESLKLPVSQVQRQLERLEREGVLASRLVGKTRVYQWNSRCGYLSQLRSLLARGSALLPEEFKRSFLSERRRPRRAGKPLPRSR